MSYSAYRCTLDALCMTRGHASAHTHTDTHTDTQALTHTHRHTHTHTHTQTRTRAHIHAHALTHLACLRPLHSQFGALGVGCAGAAVLLYEGVRIAETTLRPLPRIVSAPLGGALCGVIALKFPQVRAQLLRFPAPMSMHAFVHVCVHERVRGRALKQGWSMTGCMGAWVHWQRPAHHTYLSTLLRASSKKLFKSPPMCINKRMSLRCGTHL